VQFAGTSGYQADATTGLLLLGHRYYDASIGRFLSSDPAQAGSNWYAYCDNNPLVRVDATGLMPPLQFWLLPCHVKVMTLNTTTNLLD
jgi:RHS repeat-associated protein